MADNLSQFLKELKKQEQQIYDEINKVEKDVISEIFFALLGPRELGGTPRITGFLASNWILSLDEEKSSTVGSKTSVETTTQKTALNKILNTNLLEINNIYFNNNVEYGPLVNYGGPGRDAQNFRKKSIELGLKRLNKQRIIK